MKTIKLTAAALLLAVSALAYGAPKTTTFEVLLQNFDMAETAAGAVGFKECDECNYQRLRLTPRTTFKIDGKSLRFADFREAISSFELAGDDELNINVRRDNVTGTLASVFLYTE